jgi:hypothetical protein
VSTAWIAGIWSAARVSMPVMSAWACGERTIAHELIGEFEIVEKAALPPQQARILAS